MSVRTAPPSHVLGGNQSNAVTVARIAKDRLLGARWPRSAYLPTANRQLRQAAGTLNQRSIGDGHERMAYDRARSGPDAFGFLEATDWTTVLGSGTAGWMVTEIGITNMIVRSVTTTRIGQPS